MDFRIFQYPNGPGNVTLTVTANYAPEEAAALSELRAWNVPCLDALCYPTFQHLVDPGIIIENCIPVYADHFQNRFNSVYGWQIQLRLSPILQAYRYAVHRELLDQRDAYFGNTALPRRSPLLPR